MHILPKFVFLCALYTFTIKHTRQFHLGHLKEALQDAQPAALFDPDEFTTQDMAWHSWTPANFTYNPPKGSNETANLLNDLYYDVPPWDPPPVKNLSWPPEELHRQEIEHYFGYTFEPRYFEFYKWYYKLMKDLDAGVSRYESPLPPYNTSYTTEDYEEIAKRESPYPIPGKWTVVWGLLRRKDPLVRMERERKEKEEREKKEKAMSNKGSTKK